MRKGFPMRLLVCVCSFILIVALLGCTLPTYAILRNNTQSSIVLIQFEPSCDKKNGLKNLSMCKLKPGEWSRKFCPYDDVALIFDEGKEQLFAYDVIGAYRAFWSNYPGRKNKYPVRIVYEAKSTLTVMREEERVTDTPLLILKPQKVSDILREKGKEIVGP